LESAVAKKEAKRKANKQFYDIPHVFIATPAYDGKVDTDFAQSCISATQAATVYGIQVTGAVMGNGAFIDLARNMFVKLFLKENKECTHLLFIDADLKFEARAFVEVVRHCTEDRPVIAGVYPKRQDIEEYPVRWTPHPELSQNGIDRLWYDEQGFLMCNRVPTGFLCIRRNVLEEMSAEAPIMEIKGHGKVPRLFYTYINEQNQFIGEDFAWCDDYVKRYGKQISVWPDFDFVHGGIKGNYQRWISKHAVNVDDDGYAVRKTINKREPRRVVNV
jgi:hypothetical protein